MSFEAITTISDAENRARQIKADAQAAAAAAVEAAQAEGKAVIEAAVGKAQQEQRVSVEKVSWIFVPGTSRSW